MRAAGALLFAAGGKLGLPKEDVPKGFELGTGPGCAAAAGAGSGKLASKVWSDVAWLGLVSREC